MLFRKYKAASSNVDESAPSIMEFNNRESSTLPRPHAWTFRGTLPWHPALSSAAAVSASAGADWGLASPSN